MPTVSVIVPVYNVEPYLHRCVDSILAQTFTDFELILVDDGSPDNCGAICDEYAAKDERVHVIHQKNGGLSAARNAGIDWAFANSDSEWISFVDSDDWVNEKYLELLYKAVVVTKAEISQCVYQQTMGEVPNGFSCGSIYLLSPKEQYINWYSAFAWAKLYKKTIFETLRYPVGIVYEDLTIWYKLLFSFSNIAIVNELLYYYFQREDSIMNCDWTPKNLTRMDAWEAQVEFFNQRGDKTLIIEAVERFCRIVYEEYHAIERSERLTDAEKKENQAILARKIRKLMLNNFREVKNDTYYLWLRAVAFPRYDWSYWMVRSIPNRMKRILNRK